MATYAIGDVQGCHDALCRLLDRLNYDPAGDRLWFVGDLVNRGPDSLAVLRLVRSLGPANPCVLGNHDLHLLATRLGVRRPHRNDTLGGILEADDRDELLDWLRGLPLMHRDPVLGFTMVHAGIYPHWGIEEATRYAEEVCEVLRGPDYAALIEHMYGDQPARWSAELAGFERHRFIINCFTRMRFCSADGALELTENGPPGSQPPELVPWFELAGRKDTTTRIVFGHWASLPPVDSDRIHALDSGCVWGGTLTALQLDADDSPRRVCVTCP